MKLFGEAVNRHFPNYAVLANNPSSFDVGYGYALSFAQLTINTPTQLPLAILTRIWDRVTEVRRTQREELIKSLMIVGRANALTEFGRRRLDHFGACASFEFKSLGWNYRKCDGHADVLDLAAIPGIFHSIEIHIRDDQGITHCTCSEQREPEGHCRHALAVVANLSQFGLNPVKFTPYNVLNSINGYLCRVDPVGMPF
jgi:hypothetical protein